MIRMQLHSFSDAEIGISNSAFNGCLVHYLYAEHSVFYVNVLVVPQHLELLHAVRQLMLRALYDCKSNVNQSATDLVDELGQGDNSN